MVRAADGSFKRCWGRHAVALTALASLWPAAAGAQRVARDCPSLSEARWQELEARLRVLLGVHARAELAVELRCDAAGVEAILSERERVTRLPIGPNEEIVEGTLAVVEAELARRQSVASPANPAPNEASPPAATEPEPEGPMPGPERESKVAPASARTATARSSPPQRERDSAGLSGGIGLGLGVETWGRERPALGPRLHLALGHRELCAVAVESLGFGRLDGFTALTFSTELGVAWGAPYARGQRLGVQALLGYEWLSAAESDAAPSQTSGVWSVAFGGRVALPVEPVSLFIGPDLRIKSGDNELGPPLSVGLPAYSVLVQAGVFWIQEAMPAGR